MSILPRCRLLAVAALVPMLLAAAPSWSQSDVTISHYFHR